LIVDCVTPTDTIKYNSFGDVNVGQAQFDAGVLNNVDTSSSPNDVLLAANLDKGDGPTGL